MEKNLSAIKEPLVITVTTLPWLARQGVIRGAERVGLDAVIDHVEVDLGERRVRLSGVSLSNGSRQATRWKGRWSHRFTTKRRTSFRFANGESMISTP